MGADPHIPSIISLAIRRSVDFAKWISRLRADDNWIAG
jgi:hypothetical protein